VASGAGRCQHVLSRGRVAARWDGDDRSQGIGDAARLVSGASELIAAFRQPAWVAEQPELHLLPHVEAWCQRDRRLIATGAYHDGAEPYVLDLEWHARPAACGKPLG
jgi:hypothetical protein